MLDRWMMVTPEEELLILKQFLRFGETRPIVELMTLQCLAAVNCLADPQLRPAPKSRQSNISTFIERHRGTAGKFRNSRDDSHLVAGVCRFEKSSVADGNDTIHHFENSPSGLSLLLPFHFPSSTFQCLLPVTKVSKLYLYPEHITVSHASLFCSYKQYMTLCLVFMSYSRRNEA